MDSFVERIKSAVWYLLGNPAPRLDGFIVAGLGLLAMVLLLGRMVGTGRLENAGPLGVLLVAAVGVALMIASVMFLKPLIGSFVEESFLYFAVLCASIVVSMLIVVPLMMLTHRANSVSSVPSWGVSIVAGDEYHTDRASRIRCGQFGIKQGSGNESQIHGDVEVSGEPIAEPIGGPGQTG